MNEPYYESNSEAAPFNNLLFTAAVAKLTSDFLKGVSIGIDKTQMNQRGGQGNIPPQTIEKTAEQLEKKSDELQEDAKGLDTMAADFASDTIEDAFKRSILLADKMFASIIDSMTENVLDKPMGELVQSSKERLITVATLIQRIAQDEEARAALRTFAEALTATGIELLEDLKPSIEKLTEKALELANKVGKQSAKGLTQTALQTAQAAIAEIPGLGGVIDLFLAMGVGANNLAKIVSTISSTGGETAIEAAKMVNKGKASIDRGKARIDNAMGGLEAVTSKLGTPSSQTRPAQSPQQIGGKKNMKKLKTRIRKNSVRLLKTISEFQRTMPKTRRNRRNTSTRKRRYRKHSRK